MLWKVLTLVDLDTGNLQRTCVQSLSISVGLCVLEQISQELGGLDRPASLADTKLLAYK